MARIRTIKPTFWSSMQVTNCSFTARLLFIGMWNFCDDNGVIITAAKNLKMKIFPGDDITISEIEQCCNELVSQGLVEKYEANEIEYFHVTGWHHQKINRPQESDNPLPSQKVPKPNGSGTSGSHGTFNEQSVNHHESSNDHSLGKGKEGYKDSKEGGKESNKRSRASDSGGVVPVVIPWQSVPDDQIQWANGFLSEQGLMLDKDLSVVADGFLDYWRGLGSVAKAKKTDWPATWRNWIRRIAMPAGSRRVAAKPGQPLAQKDYRKGATGFDDMPEWLRQGVH